MRVIRLLGARAASEAAQPRERSHQTKPGREAEGPGQRAAGAEGLYVTTLDPGNSPMALYAQRGRAPRVIDTMFSNKKTSTLHAGCRMQHKSSHHTAHMDIGHAPLLLPTSVLTISPMRCAGQRRTGACLVRRPRRRPRCMSRRCTWGTASAARERVRAVRGRSSRRPAQRQSLPHRVLPNSSGRPSTSTPRRH